MEPILVVPLILGAAGLVYAARQAQKRWVATLQWVADDLGLTAVKGTWRKSAHATGSVDGHPVTVDTYQVSTGKSSQVFTRVRVETGLGGQLELGAEGMLSALGKAFMGEDVSLGVPSVDDLLVIRAPRPSAALARLGHHGREAAVTAINGEGARLKDGTLTWSVRGRINDPIRLVGVVRALTGLATALTIEDRHEALADHVARDPEAGFRYRCLEALAQEAPRSPAAQRAAQAALADISPHVRLAAMRLFQVGEPSDVAALVADDGTPSEVRASAIELLTQRFSSARELVLPALRRAFERGRQEALGAAVEALTSLGEVPGVAELRARLRDADVAASAAIARALGRHEPQEAQPLLLELLGSEEVDIATAAATSLGEVGTVAAVSALDDAGRGLTTARAMKQATRTAIHRIQERAGGVGGALTLASGPDAGGELSMQSIEEGALSEVEG